MADEFVDFYEALNLSPEAQRKEVHRRISELYLEAQRNLDHRDFGKKIKYQEMFEVVLPRARYILLDATRREEYDGLVRAFRGVDAPAPVPDAPPEPAFGAGDASIFRLAETEDASSHRVAGRAPRIEALPTPALDSAQMAAQRDEMWAKWKSGLEAAIARDETEPESAKPAPRPGSTQPATPQNEVSADASAPRKPRPQASSISFNFGNNSSPDEEERARATAFEIELQKAERKRAVIKEILDSVGLKGTLLGGLGTAISLGALLITGMGHFYPREGAPQLPLPSALAWLLGIAIVLGAAVFAATELSKSMRRQASTELSRLPIEELLRKVGRSY